MKDGQVLLIRKKRGLGAGKINGPGGKMDPGESPLECAVRETEEELRIHAMGVREIGRLAFQFVDGMSLFVHVFRADDFEGIPAETDEASPIWTPVDRMPFEEMWADDIHWFPYFLEEQPFVGFFDFDDDTMMSHQVTAVDRLPS